MQPSVFRAATRSAACLFALVFFALCVNWAAMGEPGWSQRYSIGAQRCAVPVAACAIGIETALSRFAIDGGRLRLLRTHQPAGNPAALSAPVRRQRGCLPAHTAIDVADLALRLAPSGAPDAHVACRWLYRLRRRVLDLPAAQWPLRGGTCTGYLGQAFR